MLSLEVRWRYESAGALIVTAEIAPVDFARLDALRRIHYPLERNRVPAHLTIFRSLPPSAEAEARRALARAAFCVAPKVIQSGVMDLGGGVAIRLRSAELDCLRDRLADDFHGLLSAQDRGGWIPHVTIQNKVEPKAARALLQSLKDAFVARPLAISGLQLIRYRLGDWEKLATYPFRSVS